MRPIELNVKYNIAGRGLFLYDTREANGSTRVEYHKNVVPYFLEGFDVRLLINYVTAWIKMAVKMKLRVFKK